MIGFKGLLIFIGGSPRPGYLLLDYYAFFAVKLLVLYIDGYVLVALKVEQNRDSVTPVKGTIVIDYVHEFVYLITY